MFSDLSADALVIDFGTHLAFEALIYDHRQHEGRLGPPLTLNPLNHFPITFIFYLQFVLPAL